MFDLDGTLFDTKQDLATAVNLTLEDFGLPSKPPELIYTYVGDGVRKLLERSLDGFGAGHFERALTLFRGHYMTHLTDTTCFYPGVISVLEHFNHKKKAVVTNKPAEYTNKLMQDLNAHHHFDFIIGSDTTVRLKPHPDMILSTLERLAVSPQRALMIGDSVNDIKAGQEAGVKVCAVGYGLGDRDGLKKAEPDFFCDNILELKEHIE
jgi:phosphoglycolate phosphatase